MWPAAFYQREKGQQRRVCECCVQPCSLFTVSSCAEGPAVMTSLRSAEHLQPGCGLRQSVACLCRWHLLPWGPGLFLLFPGSWMWTCVDSIVCRGVMSGGDGEESSYIHTYCGCQVEITLWPGWVQILSFSCSFEEQIYEQHGFKEDTCMWFLLLFTVWAAAAPVMICGSSLMNVRIFADWVRAGLGWQLECADWASARFKLSALQTQSETLSHNVTFFWWQPS